MLLHKPDNIYVAALLSHLWKRSPKCELRTLVGYKIQYGYNVTVTFL
jgi:hypothetical protein